MMQNKRDKKICEDYWTYNNKVGFIRHIQSLCQKYELSSHMLFETISKCYAFLDDVLCKYCGSACPIEVPADIPYMHSKIGGVSKSMLALDEAIVDIKEHHIERLKVIVEFLRKSTSLSNCSPQSVS